MSLLTICSVLCPLPAILILLFGTFGEAKKELREIGILIFSFVLIDIICYIFAKAQMNNLPFFHLITLIELVIFTRIYSLNTAGLRKKLIISLGVVGTIWLVINSSFFVSILEFNSTARVIQALIILSFTIIWFSEVFVNLKDEKLTHDPIFYLTTGVLIYFTGSAVIFGMFKELLTSDVKLLMELWDVHSILNIVMNLFLALAINKYRVKSAVMP